jgi:hypothetical protein
MYKKFLAGLGGALALNILHEIVRKNFDNVPHINEVGEEALVKITDKTNIDLTDKDHIYAATLAGDIIGNGLYYASTATTHDVTSGLLMGIATVALPKSLGLDDKPVAENNQIKAMTIGYYVFGALVTKFIYDKIK